MGELFALSAALVWALSVILFRQSEAVSAQGINLFKNLVGIFLLVFTLPLMGVSIDFDRPAADWWILIVSGVLGIAIADTLIFMALRRLGPSLLAVVDCAYAPIIVVLSVLMLDETPGSAFAIGAVLVVGGVLLAAGDRVELGAADRARIRLGVGYGIVGVAAMGVAIVMVKPVLERGSLVEVSLVRLIAGVAGQAVWIAVDKSQRDALNALRPGPVWRTLLPASVLGSYVAMLLWLAGFKHTDASSAALLNQMSTVFTIVLARAILKEYVSPRRALGSGFAIVGAVLVMVV